MKTMKYILMSLVLIELVFVAFFPIPFLGLLASFLFTPLAHFVSWKDLFEVNILYGSIIGIRGIDTAFFLINLFNAQVLPYFIGYFSALAATIVLSTIMQKVGYRFLPKRLKFERVAY